MTIANHEGLPSSGAPKQRTPNDDAWVIVPVFNEASVVRNVLNGLLAYFPNVVAVDDGSNDGTSAEIRSTKARIVRHPVNLGTGAALQTGIDFAMRDTRAGYFVTFDADGQHEPADAAAMVARLRHGDVQILLGSRFLGSAREMRSSRRALLKAARNFEWITTGLRLSDAHNGLRAFTRDFAAQVRLTFSDFAHASELLRHISKSGLRYAEHPVTVNYTDYSRAKGQRNINAVNIAVDVWFQHLLRGGDR
jgi:glycosyltransferase involved in cell wall biosynthesis